MENSQSRSKSSADLDPAAQHLPDCTLEKKIGSDSPLPLDEYVSQGNVPRSTLEKVSKGVCEVMLDNGNRGTGFLAKFTRFNGSWLYGLFTNNHVVSEGNLADDKTFTIHFDAVSDGTKLVETVSTTGTFRFTCPILDVTFVRFEDEDRKRLSSKGCQFLEVELEWKGNENDQLFVLQYPKRHILCSADGPFLQNYGFNMFHLVSTDSGSSGSPVALFNGMVIGIHKSAPKSDNLQYNIAVAIKAVVKAIRPFFRAPEIATQVFCNYVSIDQDYAAKLLTFGLQKVPLKQDSKFQLMYVSQAKETSIWYVPTSHGWYWTPAPTYPFAKIPNWMSVSQHEVVGGEWDGQTPTQKNIEIIDWLFQHDIDCGNLLC